MPGVAVIATSRVSLYFSLLGSVLEGDLCTYWCYVYVPVWDPFRVSFGSILVSFGIVSVRLGLFRISLGQFLLVYVSFGPFWVPSGGHID